MDGKLYAYVLSSDDPRIGDEMLIDGWMEPDQLASCKEAAGFDRAVCHEWLGWQHSVGSVLWECGLAE